MGNWAIIITGTGAHHNKDYPGDADKIFKKTVLKKRFKHIKLVIEIDCYQYLMLRAEWRRRRMMFKKRVG